MADAIQAEHLAYAYPGAEGGPGISVFRDLNLNIEAGTFVAILGRNGCGKSTLGQALQRHRPGRPAAPLWCLEWIPGMRAI